MPRSSRSRAPRWRDDGALGFRLWRMGGEAGMSEPHTHADVEINYLHDGGRVTYLHAGERRRIPAGRLAVLWGGVPHQALEPGIEGTGVWLTFPLAWLLQWRLPEAFVAGLLEGEIVLGRPDENEAGRMARWAEDFESGQPLRRRALRLELEARLVRLAAEQPAPRCGRGRSRAPEAAGAAAHAERVTAYLARHYAEPLTIPAVAAAIGLHPAYMMRVFKRACRLSVGDYLTRLRVAHAQRLLVTTDGKILDVALESGFGSVAAFYQAFARHGGGSSPRAYRRAHR